MMVRGGKCTSHGNLSSSLYLRRGAIGLALSFEHFAEEYSRLRATFPQIAVDYEFSNFGFLSGESGGNFPAILSVVDISPVRSILTAS